MTMDQSDDNNNYNANISIGGVVDVQARKIDKVDPSLRVLRFLYFRL